MKCNSKISFKLIPLIVFVAEGHKSVLPVLSYKSWAQINTVLLYTIL